MKNGFGQLLIIRRTADVAETKMKRDSHEPN